MKGIKILDFEGKSLENNVQQGWVSTHFIFLKRRHIVDIIHKSYFSNDNDLYHLLEGIKKQKKSHPNKYCLAKKGTIQPTRGLQWYLQHIT